MKEKRRIKRLRFVTPELIIGNGLRMPILMKDKIKIDGKEYIRFAVKGTDGFIQKYNLPNAPYYVKDFPLELIREGLQEPHTLRATFVACGWNRESAALKEWNPALFREVKELKNQISLLKAQNFRLSEDNRKLMTRPQEISQGVLRDMLKWKKALGKEVVYESDLKKEGKF